jgi:23S rRNA pseudouridine2605 synthase
VLAQCGYGSLRGLEELIIAGRITVNRLPAGVGQKVGPNDQVRINGELVRLRFAAPRVRVLLYHKPAGEIVSRADPEGRPTVFDKLPRLGSAKWIAVGRLDFNSEGLLMFTTLGELANRLMHPRYEVEREYSVRVMGTLTPDQERQLLEGIELDDGPAKVLALADGGGEGANHWYKIVLPEGRNKEVRRMFDALGLMVSRLIRTRYGVVNMPPQLKRGQMIELEREELDALMKAAGMQDDEEGDDREDRLADDWQPGNSGDRDAIQDEVDGNRGTYGPEAEEPVSEVDGNRAPPPGNHAPRDPNRQPGSGAAPLLVVAAADRALAAGRQVAGPSRVPAVDRAGGGRVVEATGAVVGALEERPAVAVSPRDRVAGLVDEAAEAAAEDTAAAVRVAATPAAGAAGPSRGLDLCPHLRARGGACLLGSVSGFCVLAFAEARPSLFQKGAHAFREVGCRRAGAEALRFR